MNDVPGIIKKLDETVINRIAAGEVVQRPANALKELIENSLDAKASQIHVTVKQGGMKLLQIQDNGTGIRKEDLNIVCERFTTSKLKEFEDLTEIATYGFRGEALSSISHVSYLTITSKTKDEKCAWRTEYIDGKPKGTSKPTAGNQGTVISAEELFYNITTRRKALRSPAEEHARIAEVVGRYAIHNASVGFSLKKQGEGATCLRTPPNSTAIENIRTIYGPTLAKELLDLKCDEWNTNLKFKAKGLMSNANYSTKKCQFLLFINHRLVDSTALRKSVELVYAAYLPKHTHPFVYLSIEIEPHNVDVNVHPTKHEVHFLHQDAIIDKIQKSVDATLLGSNSSRTYFTQALLPSACVAGLELNKVDQNDSKKSQTNKSKNNPERVYDHQMVRTDAKDQKIDKFFMKSKNESEISKESSKNVSKGSGEWNEIDLTSVLELRKEVDKLCHSGLREAVSLHSYVGAVYSHLALIQFSTKLFLTNTSSLSEELFYQIILNDFGNFGLLKLSTPVSIKELSLLALDLEESGWSEADGPKEELANYVVEILTTKADMLDEYFSLKIENDKLVTLPYLLDDYIPDLNSLPMYILRLSTEVDWESEKQCFESFARETASFFSIPKDLDFQNEDCNNSKTSWKWKIEHLIYPAIKKILKPPQCFAQDTTFLQVANLPDLYKVFERC